MRLAKIVSGGQTGVDRAALDAAIELGFLVGGWCPKGRLAEDGPIHQSYPLKETPSDDYRVRTEWNVRDSSATLILHRGRISGGTAFTQVMAAKYDRPCLCVALSAKSGLRTIADWAERQEIPTLNIAGPRESGEPGIYHQTYEFLLRLLPRLGHSK